MERITVIVPVFNSERTIKKCLESITDTTYDNYEILVVDDGSTDQSVDVIRDCQAHNNKIQLIQQKNSGVSSARNVAMRQSTGDIITFVDSDDYVVGGYLESITDAFSTEYADVVFWGFQRVSSSGEILSEKRLPEQPSSYYDCLITLSENDMFGYTWIKAFRREIVDGCSYDESLSLFEDEVFTCGAMRNPCGIVFLDKVLYCYVKSDGETLTKKTYPDFYNICESVYSAWQDLIRDKSEEWQLFLNNKARHLNMLSKYYMLERRIPRLRFCKKWSRCAYLTESVDSDHFINAVYRKKWGYVLYICFMYRLKTIMSKLLRGKGLTVSNK